MACGLEGLAAAIASFNRGLPDTELAARMFGAADGLRERLGVPLPPADFAFVECSMDTARNALGETGYNAAWSAGRSMPLEKTVAEALAAAAPADQTVEVATASGRGVLSRRERDVAALIAQGHTNTEIATLLGMARPTADKHVSNILRKLGFSSRASVQAWAIEHGLAGDDKTSS